MPAFQALSGMPYWIELLSSDVDKTREFYSEIFDWEFSDYGSDYLLARIQGLPVAGVVALPEEIPLGDTWVTYFLVDDLAATLEVVSKENGRILNPATTVRLGEMALVVDPAGALVGLVQPAGEEAFIAAGEPGTPVWHELTCARNYGEAVRFYEQLFAWTTATLDDAQAPEYTTALIDGAAFAGVFDASELTPPGVPSYWQSYIGVADVPAVAAKAVEIGGTTIHEPQDSAFGTLALLSDTTGAAFMICEVPEPVAEAAESDPLEGIDLSSLQ
ncbi:MAG: VOC family protein [Corynebacterium sp.]|nr:VOC family protein [Corynebacterium sp.]